MKFITFNQRRFRFVYLCPWRIASFELILDFIDLSFNLFPHLLHPSMTRDSLYGWALVRFELQNLYDQIFQFFAEMTTQFIVPLLHLLLHLLQALSREGCKIMQQLIEQYSQGPNINPIIIIFLKDHLWCHIFISPTECLPLGGDIISCPAKIANFNIISMIQEHILRLNKERNYLQISMHNIIYMHVTNSRQGLTKEFEGLCFTYCLVTTLISKQCPILSQLHYHIHYLLFHQCVPQLNNMGMIHNRMQINFPLQEENLILTCCTHIHLNNTHMYRLNCIAFVCLDVKGQLYTTERSYSDLFHELELGY